MPENEATSSQNRSITYTAEANDAGDVSNAIHSKTYGTETAAETAATTAAMEMDQKGSLQLKAQVGYGNTGNKETASKAETVKT